MIVKKYLRTSPFLLLGVFALIVVLYELLFERNSLEGWRYLWIQKAGLLLVFVLMTDVVLKHFLLRKYWAIWCIELFLCLGLVYYWIIS